MEELQEAIKKMKSGKAPGPDEIPPEAVKETVKKNANWLLGVLNELLRTKDF